jgi:hypothetical protein
MKFLKAKLLQGNCNFYCLFLGEQQQKTLRQIAIGLAETDN